METIGVVFGGILFLILVAVIMGIIMGFISWITNTGIRSRFGSSGIAPDDFPMMVKYIGKGIKKITNVSSNKLAQIKESLTKETTSKIEKLEKLDQLYKNGVVTYEEMTKLKEEIFRT